MKKVKKKSKKVTKVKQPKYEIVITVDANDGDYNTKISTITSSELREIKPLISAIKKCRSSNHNYGVGEYCSKEAEKQYPQFSEELHEMFQDLCPYGEYGFHSIESIVLMPSVGKKTLL